MMAGYLDIGFFDFWWWNEQHLEEHHELDSIVSTLDTVRLSCQFWKRDGDVRDQGEKMYLLIVTYLARLTDRKK